MAALKGTAWVYVGKPEHRALHMPGHRQIAVRQSDLDILPAGITDLGHEFSVAYQASTNSVPEPLVIQDRSHEQPLSSST